MSKPGEWLLTLLGIEPCRAVPAPEEVTQGVRSDKSVISWPPAPADGPLREGEPCGHPGCLSHRTHPCEGCGRIGGKTIIAKPPADGPLREALVEADFALYRATFQDAREKDYGRCCGAYGIVHAALAQPAAPPHCDICGASSTPEKITQVCDRCSAQPAPNDWVAVSERLPEEGTAVIVRRKGTRLLNWGEIVKDKDGAMWKIYGEYWELEALPHWLSAPPPPAPEER
jgi:hypothetical protein